jgi:hypothetical protein
MEVRFATQKFYSLMGFSSTIYPPPNPTYSIYPNWEFAKDEWWIGGLMAGRICNSLHDSHRIFYLP